MKLTLALLFVSILNSCGTREAVSYRVEGQKGDSGSSCTVVDTSYGAEISCEDGTSTQLFDGQDGKGCDIQDAVNGAVITCGDSSQVIYDGVDGQDGDTNLTNDSIVESIDPCGDDPNDLDEVLLITAGGDVIAYYQTGSNRFLTKLEPGNYQTTDKQKCGFTVNNDYSVSY